tara:strand:- start:14721 stop:15287 length:567 start_codon:yes stop_codon:yes gene_type:complete
MKSKKKRLKDFIPSNARWFLADLLGIDKTFTEDDLTQDELDWLRNYLQKSSSDYLEDFGEEERRALNLYSHNVTESMQNKEGRFTIKDIIKSSYANPRTSLATSIGKADIAQNALGETIIEDEYDFDLASAKHSDVSNKELLQTLIQSLSGQGQANFGDFLSKFSGRYGSRPGSGNPVRINLGKLLEY